MGTFSMLSQQKPQEQQPDIIVAGTFGGSGNIPELAK